MRKIKFKFWNSYYKKMLDDNKHVMYVSATGEVYENIRELEFSGCWLKHHEYTIPLQYTGMNDRNSVEIYEGDIVINGIFVAEVIFYQGGFCLDSDEPVGICYYDGLEVIGNIYENPELLCQSQQ